MDLSKTTPHGSVLVWCGYKKQPLDPPLCLFLQTTQRASILYYIFNYAARAPTLFIKLIKHIYMHIYNYTFFKQNFMFRHLVMFR